MRNKVIILGSNNQYDELFSSIGELSWTNRILLAAPEEVALVVFTGGADVHPHFYGGEDKRKICYTNFKRDNYEKNIFDYCRKYDVKMTGICRGFQFLNVMAGGFMYQHIESHGIGGTHGALLPHIGSSMDVTSTHHQLVGIPVDAIPIAWAYPMRSNIYIGPNGDKVDPPDHEVESAIFPNINALGAQYHPEMMENNSLCRVYYTSLVKDFMMMEMSEFVERYKPQEAEENVRNAGK